MTPLLTLMHKLLEVMAEYEVVVCRRGSGPTCSFRSSGPRIALRGQEHVVAVGVDHRREVRIDLYAGVATRQTGQERSVELPRKDLLTAGLGLVWGRLP